MRQAAIVVWSLLLAPRLVFCTAQADPIRINCGGDAFAAKDAGSGEIVHWMADTNFFFGKVFATTNQVAGTEWSTLYQSERWAQGGRLSYEIPVSVPGSYEVVLHFAEIWYVRW